MEVFLDTSFVLSCIKKKIDFIASLEGKGFKIVLPKEVYDEIKDLRRARGHDTRLAAEVALKLFEAKKLKRKSIGSYRVDEGLIRLAKDGAYVASLDREIRRHAKNRVLISNSGNDVVVERD